MIRIIITAAIIYIIWHIWQKAGSKRKVHGGTNPAIQGEMVKCDRCGTFILTNEAIADGRERYCSEGCLKGN